MCLSYAWKLLNSVLFSITLQFIFGLANIDLRSVYHINFYQNSSIKNSKTIQVSSKTHSKFTCNISVILSQLQTSIYGPNCALFFSKQTKHQFSECRLTLPRWVPCKQMCMTADVCCFWCTHCMVMVAARRYRLVGRRFVARWPGLLTQL